MNLGLSGKFALVTGASQGIGRQIALTLAAEGCNVAICARNLLRLESTVAEIEKIGVLALGVAGDVTKKTDVQRIVGTVLEEWGTLHILINNAGGGGDRTPFHSRPRPMNCGKSYTISTRWLL